MQVRIRRHESNSNKVVSKHSVSREDKCWNVEGEKEQGRRMEKNEKK